jgi:cysteinyl-tRNA synthetase
MSSKNLIKESKSNKNILPEYDGSESLTKYLSRMKDLRFQMNSHKYDKILEFLNVWLEKYKIKLKSLTDFKKISEKLLLSDETHNQKILDKYYTSLSSYLDTNNADYDSDNSSTDEYEKLEREYKIRNNILSFIKEILTTIDYTLIISKVKKTGSDKTSTIEVTYSIKMNNP